MKPLNVREWLEQRRAQGCDFASELLVIVDDLPDLQERAGLFDELAERIPEEVKKSPDLWRWFEWVTDRLAILEEVETALERYAADFSAGNGIPFVDAADKLQTMLASPRWQQYDL